jgi:hypothetical protein
MLTEGMEMDIPKHNKKATKDDADGSKHHTEILWEVGHAEN